MNAIFITFCFFMVCFLGLSSCCLAKLMEVMPEVRKLLSADDELEIREFNYALYQSQDRLNEWVRQVSEVFSHYHYKVGEVTVDFSSLGIDLKEFLLKSEDYCLKHN